HLAGGPAIACRGAEEERIGPDHVFGRGSGDVAGPLLLCFPRLLGIDHFLRGRLSDLPQANLGSCLAGGLGGYLGHLVIGSIGAVVNNGDVDVCHGDGMKQMNRFGANDGSQAGETADVAFDGAWTLPSAAGRSFVSVGTTSPSRRCSSVWVTPRPRSRSTW